MKHVVWFAFGVTACSGAPRTAVETAPVPAAPAPAPQSIGGPRTDPVYVAKARADSARLPYTQADVHFMSGMISHHAQAIVMARWAPTHDASPAVRILCERIINAQSDEIALMQQWLADRLQPVPEASPKGMKMQMGGMEHVTLMPGMLSDEQMAQLDLVRGAEFDRLFLTFMIQHHRGAVEMVKVLMAADGAAQDETVWKFSSDVNVDQTTEIARMERMLAALGSARPS